jgi:hypothetical protein
VAFVESAETIGVALLGVLFNENISVFTRLGMAIAGIGRGTGFGATDATGATETAATGRLAANAAGKVSARSVSAVTLTFRAPLDFNSSRCVIVASSS